MKRIPINCCKCGRFVGKEGDPDITYDNYNGGYEIGYPKCGNCLRVEDTQGEGGHEGN